jgi:DNA phosphorothioation-dependent restriction protein DptG
MIFTERIKLIANFFQPLWYGRLQNSSISANGNKFMDYSRRGNYEIYLVHYDLADHDAQLTLIPDFYFHVHAYSIQTIRKFNTYLLAEFNTFRLAAI